MTYDTVAAFAQQAGTIFFMTVFLAGCAYAFLPRKKDEFDRAARMPLEGDDQ